MLTALTVNEVADPHLFGADSLGSVRGPQEKADWNLVPESM